MRQVSTSAHVGCRRLKPPFKAKVTVWHAARVDMPITVTAHAITETEFNMLEKWMPPDMDAACTGEMVERATPTELKGSVQLQHTFSLVRAPRALNARGGWLHPRSTWLLARTNAVDWGLSLHTADHVCTALCAFERWQPRYGSQCVRSAFAGGKRERSAEHGRAEPDDPSGASHARR